LVVRLLLSVTAIRGVFERVEDEDEEQMANEVEEEEHRPRRVYLRSPGTPEPMCLGISYFSEDDD
jgi:hypothetical protein